MFAIGNDELEKNDKVGNEIKCPTCGKNHPIEYGNKKMPDGSLQPSKTLAFYECRGKLFLAGINGKQVYGKSHSSK